VHRSPASVVVNARSSAAVAARVVFERLPTRVRSTIRGNVAALTGVSQLKRNQAMLASRVARLAPQAPPPLSSLVADPRFPEAVRSRICTEAQLSEPWFADWCAALGELPRANRKLWEHAYIAHALDALGQLRAGRRGVGFGVGREPLVSLFAGRGCEILATDLPSHSEGARSWTNTGQHADDLTELNVAELCHPDEFRSLVSFRNVDMRSIPSDLRGFDFCWSACALEHLGSLDAGTTFVEQSLSAVRPGGVAVHTTELILSSSTSTIEHGHTVLYRPTDLETLARRLEAGGHEVARLDLNPGHGVLDEYVDVPPYVDAPHLRLLYRGHVITSVAVVIRRGEHS
jgi:hypothetical protein